MQNNINFNRMLVEMWKNNLLVMKVIVKAPIEPPHDKTKKMTCAPFKDSDQLGHPPSLISLRCALDG